MPIADPSPAERAPPAMTRTESRPTTRYRDRDLSTCPQQLRLCEVVTRGLAGVSLPGRKNALELAVVHLQEHPASGGLLVANIGGSHEAIGVEIVDVLQRRQEA